MWKKIDERRCFRSRHWPDRLAFSLLQHVTCQHQSHFPGFINVMHPTQSKTQHNCYDPNDLVYLIHSIRVVFLFAEQQIQMCVRLVEFRRLTQRRSQQCAHSLTLQFELQSSGWRTRRLSDHKANEPHGLRSKQQRVVTSRVSEHIIREPRDDAHGRWCGLHGIWRTHGWIHELVLCRKTSIKVRNESSYLMFVNGQWSLSAVVIITAEEEEVRSSSRKRGNHRLCPQNDY